MCLETWRRDADQARESGGQSAREDSTHGSSFRLAFGRPGVLQCSCRCGEPAATARHQGAHHVERPLAAAPTFPGRPSAAAMRVLLCCRVRGCPGRSVRAGPRLGSHKLAMPRGLRPRMQSRLTVRTRDVQFQHRPLPPASHGLQGTRCVPRRPRLPVGAEYPGASGPGASGPGSIVRPAAKLDTALSVARAIPLG